MDMNTGELTILEDYCRISQECARLEKERVRLRALIDKMGLEPGFSLAILGGILSLSPGQRKLLILDGVELAKALGNEFFAKNVTMPIGKLENTFDQGIVERLVDKQLVQIHYTKPILKFQTDIK